MSNFGKRDFILLNSEIFLMLEQKEIFLCRELIE